MRPEKGRVRYHCRSKAQGLGCTGSGSFLDTYEQQIVTDLAAFELPSDWKAAILAEARRQHAEQDADSQRRSELEGRLERLKELYTWGDLTREQYQTQRTALEQELARLTPVQEPEGRLEALAAYLESLPAAWVDATPEQRNQLANILYRDVWVNGPVVEYVRPQPDLEPLFRARTGAAQPTEGTKSETTCHQDGLSHSMMAGAIPMGNEAA